MARKKTVETVEVRQVTDREARLASRLAQLYSLDKGHPGAVERIKEYKDQMAKEGFEPPRTLVEAQFLAQVNKEQDGHGPL